jgi:hypothetical protein
MQSVKAIIVLSQALSASVFALRLNVNQPAIGDKDKVDLFKSNKKSGEWVVHIQGDGPNNMKSDLNGISVLANKDGLEHGYMDLPYFVRGSNYVRLPGWVQRAGNNLHQLMHVIAYAESKNIPTVQLPEDGPVRKLFDLPNVLNVKPKVSSDANCTFSESYFYEKCSLGYSKEYYRQALLTYVKPYLRPEVAKVCKSKNRKSSDLVIHLRGQDLVNKAHPEGRMPPCSFYQHLVETHKFSSVTLMAQDGRRDQLCRPQILEMLSKSAVKVRETDHSLFDDVCTLMTSQHVAFGLTTFAESFTMMNEQLAKVYVPAIKYNGLHMGDIQYGGNSDMSGTLECNDNVQSCAKGAIEYELYDIPDFKKVRTGVSKVSYMHQEDLVYSPPKHTCRQCML